MSKLKDECTQERSRAITASVDVEHLQVTVNLHVILQAQKGLCQAPCISSEI